MPIQTDLSVSPYFDDFDANKDYYKILFRPGVAVQTRELNQLQTLLQKQIERFGDNVFKRGTIIDGCDITFNSIFPYVKIRDSATDGSPLDVNAFIGYNLKNQANISPLIATVTAANSGFESQNPNLNTLYVRYINSGTSNVGGVATEEATFAANQQLTVYDPDMIIERVTSYNDSAGFSNTDTVVFLSAIAIQNSSGGKAFSNNFFVGDHINDTVANVQVVAVDSTSNAEAVILRVKPRAQDLQIGNTAKWSLYVNTSIRSTNTNPSDIATIVQIIGTGAAATLKTGAFGEVDQIAVTQKGSGYTVLPTVSIASQSASVSQIAAANLIPQNYLTTITVANNTVAPIGTGYAVTVGEGVIYQKGYFSRVAEQLVVVDKYANTPDAVAVGFDTTEEIINSNQDPSLLDNATGAPNESAPGANRLKLSPKLITLSKSTADANSEFFSIVEFSEGRPYKQNRQTVYNIIGNEMARRTYEESGNYVIDQFLLGTLSPESLNDERTQFRVQIDPGTAYINGKRVSTVLNYATTVDKGISTIQSNNVTVSLNYGKYIRINQVGGAFVFKTGGLVNFYATARQYITTQIGTLPGVSGLGNGMGSARIRSIVLESGVPGTATAVYRLYLFDIRMGVSKNFSNVRSVFYNGADKAIGDLVLENGEAVIKDNTAAALVYPAGVKAVKSVNNISYVYRTFSNNFTLASNGVITFSTIGGETFPYTGGSTLTTNQERDLIVVPLANAQLASNISGGITCNTTSTQVNGTSTAFSSTLQVGDFIKIANSTVSVIGQVNNIVSDTVLNLRAAPTSTFTAANAVVYFPQYAPIPLERATRSANVNTTSNTMYIDLGAAVNVATTVAVAYNVKSSNTTPVTKSVNRDRFVRIQTDTNAAGVDGPWALGVSDVFRLKKVYIGSNNSFTETSPNVTDVTSSFYIDHNQSEDAYGISYLYKKPGDALTINSGEFILVKFDYFIDAGEGLKAPGDSGSYNVNDTIPLANATSTINTLEIPEVYDARGQYYDLRDTFDFRPQTANTVAPTTNAATAPLNPTEPTNANRFSATDKRFPAPDSVMTGTIEYYVGRTDRVVIGDNGEFSVISGTAGSTTAPPAPENALTINILNIPPYPSLPSKLSAQTVQYIDTGVANEKYINKRFINYQVSTAITPAQRQTLQPRGYTMSDIGQLERRIADLEYYTSFTLLETMAQKRVIPSSASANLERFKFGYFVDSFNSYDYSERTNPAYKASIIDGYLSPPVDEINLVIEPSSNTQTLPYVEHLLVAQTRATDGPVVTITVTNTSPAIVQTTTSVRQSQRSTARSDSGNVYEDFFYKMSNTAGPVGFYINARDNNVGVEFFQSQAENGPWTAVASSATAAPLTSSDISTYGLSSLNDGRKIEHVGSMERKSYPAGRSWGTFIEDHFKVNFTHQPSNGQYYRVRVYKGEKHGGFLQSSKSGTYGFLLRFPIDVTVNTTTVNGTSPTANYLLTYRGAILLNGNSIYQRLVYTDTYTYGVTALPLVTNQVLGSGSYIAAEQTMGVKVTGLRPGTSHKIYIDNVDVTFRAKQTGRTIGSGLISDDSGIIDLVIYVGANVNATTEIEKAAAAVLQTAGTKSLAIKSIDGQSLSSTTIPVPGYTKVVTTYVPITLPFGGSFALGYSTIVKA